MDARTAERMSTLTSAFYEKVAHSFSATRARPWRGWEVLEERLGRSGDAALTLFDVACGNLRYERFLQPRVGRLEAWCCDNCTELVASASPVADSVHFLECDLAHLLKDGTDLSWPGLVPCDRCVSFGFMHHLPLFEQRLHLLELLVRTARPGGHVVVTFWQFLNDARIRAKARPVEGAGEHDYLLGWQDETDVWRFCHHVSDDEVDTLVARVADEAFEVMRFTADGHRGDLNRYLVLGRR